MNDWVTLLYSRKLTQHCKTNYNGKNKNLLMTKKKKKKKRLVTVGGGAVC